MPQLLSKPQVVVGPGYLYSSDFEDCYFQKESPISEINHVFVQGSSLLQYWDQCDAIGQKQCCIGETGFGSGLNFVVVWQHWQQWCQLNPASCLQLHFISVESALLESSDLQKLYQAFPKFASLVSILIEHWPPPWRGCHARQLPGRLYLTLLLGDSVDMLHEHAFIADIWFLDGFAPSRNQRMWSVALYEQLALHSKEGTRLATFTAAGHVRRGLKAVGFQVEKRPGYRKREMIVGVFSPMKLSSESICTDCQGVVQRNIVKRQRRFAVIGAGYGGMHVAHVLSEQGIAIDLFDQNSQSMQGASDNIAHLLYMNPRIVNNTFNQFFEHAYSYALSEYRQHAGITSTCVLHIRQDKCAQWTQKQLQDHWPETWLRWVDAQQASKDASVPLPWDCLAMTHGLVIEPHIFAAGILQSSHNIRSLFGHQVIALQAQDNGWLVSAMQHRSSLGVSTESSFCEYYDGVVIAAGVGCFKLLDMLGNCCLGSDISKPSHWRYPLRPIAGQSSVLPSASVHLSSLKSAVCGKVYVTPSLNGQIAFGSSFYPDQIDAGITVDDHIKNLKCLIELFQLNTTPEALLPDIVTGFSGTRVQTTDYLPMVGSVFPELGSHLYIAAGFGAKGSMVAPFAAGLLRQYICQTAPVASHAMFKLVDPARFARRLISP